jgi:hypothetical protein
MQLCVNCEVDERSKSVQSQTFVRQSSTFWACERVSVDAMTNDWDEEA